MSKIKSVEALEILDSRGNPTLEVVVSDENGLNGRAAVPSGASTGEHEAIELRDKDPQRYGGKGVLKAVSHVNGPIQSLLQGKEVAHQREIDALLIKGDGTSNKSNWGANAILGVSLAVARLGALHAQLPLYAYIGGPSSHLLPCPMMNIINGGAHANNSLDFQEFMIRPKGASTFSEALRWGAEIFHKLKFLLAEKKFSTAVGDEGGFAPNLRSNEEALELIMSAIEKSGFRPGHDVTIALDVAASSFYDKAQHRYKMGTSLTTTEELIENLVLLSQKFPIDSIEDGLDENDWMGWQELSRRLGKRVQLVGDDIFVTNPHYLKKGIDLNVANAILIKLNQIGTLTETLDTISLAKNHRYATIISHRSGETEDTFIADLAVATNGGQIKTGSLSRTDRVAKYNRLLWIERELGSEAVFKDGLQQHEMSL